MPSGNSSDSVSHARGDDYKMRTHLTGLLIVAVACSLWGCGARRSASDQTLGVLNADLNRDSSHPVDVSLVVSPHPIQLDKDVLLTITIRAPSEIDVEIPELADRLQGFALNGSYDVEPVTAGGQTTWQRRAKLTPVVSDEYRLAPMAIAFTDRSSIPPVTGWFPTRPVVFTRAQLPGSNTGVRMDLVPRWIYPSFGTILLYAGLVLVLAGAIVLIVFLMRRLRKEAILRRLTPIERAMRELSVLLDKRLIERDLVKEFYLELTLIVRTYIERSHGIRAPEQTTQEFLNAVANNPLFSAGVIATLKSFLEAADLVKFAAHRPGTDTIDAAMTTARQYIEADAATSSNSNEDQ